MKKKKTIDSVKCVVCGSDDTYTEYEKAILYSDFGDEQENVEYRCDTCNRCKESGDMSGKKENDNITIKVIDRLHRKSFLNIIKDLGDIEPTSFASIERVLHIPQKTISRWVESSETPPIELIQLLKFVSEFPWMLDVAGHRHNKNMTKKIFVNQLKLEIDKVLHNIITR